MNESARAEFEKWISDPPFERGIERNPNDETKYAWPGQYIDSEVQLCWETWREALNRPCITRLSKSAKSGETFAVYLRDGLKILIGRERGVTGKVWLDIQQQSIIGTK